MTAATPGRDAVLSLLDLFESDINHIDVTPHRREILKYGLRLAAKPSDDVDYSFDLRETLKAVLEHFGVDGAAKVTRHVMMARRSRDSNAEIDRLEELLSTTGEPKP